MLYVQRYIIFHPKCTTKLHSQTLPAIRLGHVPFGQWNKILSESSTSFVPSLSDAEYPAEDSRTLEDDRDTPGSVND